MRHNAYGWLAACGFTIGLLAAAGVQLQTASAADDVDFQKSIAFCGTQPVSTVVADQNNLKEFAKNAVSENEDVAKTAMEKLREIGPAGSAALLDAHKETIDKHVAEGATRSTEHDWQRLRTALDTVAGQRDSLSSRLFWYTDFEAAKKAAKESGKPILSLRLLGKLTDEFSCANSRFFRSTLYTNEEIGKMLRKKFVLHWESVRPVPKVTIDFGDGRKLERTLTGNSIHYILDSDGRVIDALPGLYGPKAFLQGLVAAQIAIADVPKTGDEAARTAALQEYHRISSATITRCWANDLFSLGLANSTPTSTTDSGQPAGGSAVKANKASATKSFVENPILVAALADPNVLVTKTDDAVWDRIAELHRDDAQLDAASLAFIRSQNPTAGRAGSLAISKRAVENPLVALVRNLQQTTAIDSIRNQYTFHRQIHDWLADGAYSVNVSVNDLNNRVYAELFLTPSSDPWLGLIPGNVYTALDDNGVCVKQ